MHKALQGILDKMPSSSEKTHAFMIFVILSGYYDGTLSIYDFKNDIKVIMDAMNDEDKK